ncbi:MAG: hypothetical protein JXC32_20400 [Anaerolineae bacterium]|nr:hypothetical protein [Anaerolineae bacterium]
MRRQDRAARAPGLGLALRCLLLAVVLGRLVGDPVPVPVRAQVNPATHLQALINQVRLNEGLAPLGHSALLTQAAQRHADDLVTLGQVTHEGSDGSDYQQRIREARYQAWNDGLMVNEVLWAGLGTADDALVWFYTNPEWATLTDGRYREAGVGYADDNGVRYFVVTLGSRPGVLPIFINDGYSTTESPAVALRLTNEEAVPMGDAAWIGQAIEIRTNNAPDFTGLPWQPWEPLVPWALPSEEPGEYAVYVEFRDGADRTAIAEDTIRLVAPGESPPTPTPFLALPERSGSPAGATPEAETPAPEIPGDGTAPPTVPPATLPPDIEITPMPVVPEVGDEPITPYPTWTPLPTETPAVSGDPQANLPIVLAFLLQGAALLIGVAVFLRRH